MPICVLLFLIFLQKIIIIFNMNKKIKELLVELLMHETVVGSWGVTEINIGENEVSFRVSGFNYKGIVQLRCNDEY